MHKTIITALTGLVVLAMTAPLASAAHCNGVITQVDVGTETLYVDDRSDDVGDINHWFYLESNDQDDLQSGGDNAVLQDIPGVIIFTDPCAHGNPDTLLL